MKNDIIFIIGPGRSGTSLVTGLLAEMGVWVGNHSPRRPAYNPKGFFENFGFKHFVQQVYKDCKVDCVTTAGWPVIKTTPQYTDFNEQMMAFIRRDGYRNGPAVLKNPQQSAILPLFKEHVPDAIYLFVDRNREDTIASWAKKESHADVPLNLIEEWVDGANAACVLHATHTVKAEELIQGNTAALEHIITDVGLVWDAEKAAEFIEPSYWHGKT